MSKKRAVLLVLVVEVFVYLFLLVGLPAFENAVSCYTLSSRELFALPLILYFMPGLIGLFLIVVIFKRRKEVENA